MPHASFWGRPSSSMAFDATDFERLQRFFDELPTPIDHVLITGPGPHYAPLAEFDVEKARRDIDAHLLPLHAARYAASKVRPGGTLLIHGWHWRTPHGAGAGLISPLTAAMPASTKNLALELAPIRVNLIAAGFVDTPRSVALLGDQLGRASRAAPHDAADPARGRPCRHRRARGRTLQSPEQRTTSTAGSSWSRASPRGLDWRRYGRSDL